MNLIDIKDGKVKITARTSISHNGQVYRGVDEINELVKRVLPDESEQANDTATKAAKKLTKSQQRRHDAQRAAASPAPQAGRTEPSAATEPAAGQDDAQAAAQPTDSK